MALIEFTTEEDFIKNRSTYITWSNMANGDTGQPHSFAGHPDKTFQVFGNFGVGGEVTFEGSNDPRVVTDPNNAVWFTLNDPQTLPLVKTSPGGDLIIENPRYTRPRISNGDGTTSITVIVACRMSGR